MSGAKSEREKGTYFEELILCYLRNEASYRDLYSRVWTYADWAKEQGLDKRDTGIDLVAKTAGTGTSRMGLFESATSGPPPCASSHRRCASSSTTNDSPRSSQRGRSSARA